MNASLVTYAAENDLMQKINTMIDLRKNGNFEECISIADEILANDKTFMEAYYNKSMAYFRMNKIEDVLNVLTLQLQLNPNNELAIYNAACACSILGKSDQAIGYLEKLLTLNIGMKKDIRADNDFNAISQMDGFKQLTGISVRVGGELLDFDVLPFITTEGRTMLPMRKVFEALGAQIAWDDSSQTVTATKDGISISLTIDKKLANINGVYKEMEVPPMLVENRTLVPVRFIAEALGAQVTWDPDNELVEILSIANNGTVNNYNSMKEELDRLTVVSVIDGIWPEPYHLSGTEGITLIIAKDSKSLDLMNSLDSASRAKYMYQTTLANYALVVGCEPVHMKFVYNGKVYYSGDMYYDKKGEGIELTYYEKGLPINVVKQYKNTLNYKDFYLLPVSQQTTSKIDE